MKQKIFVLYTGGTIGMTQSSEGLRPDTALVSQALSPFSDDLSKDAECATDSSETIVRKTCFASMILFFRELTIAYPGRWDK